MADPKIKTISPTVKQVSSNRAPGATPNSNAGSTKIQSESIFAAPFATTVNESKRSGHNEHSAAIFSNQVAPTSPMTPILQNQFNPTLPQQGKQSTINNNAFNASTTFGKISTVITGMSVGTAAVGYYGASLATAGVTLGVSLLVGIVVTGASYFYLDSSGKNPNAQ